MRTESHIDAHTTGRTAQDRARHAKLQAAAAEREAAELRAATETRTDAEARAALRTVKRSPEQLAKDAESARQQLARTLDEIEARLNPVAQAKRLVREGRGRLNALRRQHPEYLVAGAIAVAALAGGLVWLGSRSLRK